MISVKGFKAQSLFAQVDASSITFIRIAFGSIIAWEACRYLSKGWVSRYFIEPDFYFKYYLFEWVQPLSPSGMYLVFYALFTCGVLFALGLLYRLAAVAIFLLISYIFLLDQANYLNHIYLTIILSFYMALIPANRNLALDLAWHNPDFRSSSISQWCIWILRAQLAIVYFYAAFAKINPDWLSGQPMQIWLANRADDQFPGSLLAQPWVGLAASYAGLIIDLLIVPLLLWRKTRLFAFISVCIFHLANMYLFHIGIFPPMMICLTTIFFDADWPKKLAHLVKPRSRPDTAKQYSGSLSLTQKWGITTLGLFFLLQVLFPLRHFLYPGNVSWTEEGHRFSWHMKLRSKDGEANFRVVNKKTKEEIAIQPKKHLTRKQRGEMVTRPDMILQFAHHLRDKYHVILNTPVEVYVDAICSLNGRKEQRLIDPNIDLTTIERNLQTSSWILPLQDTLSGDVVDTD